MSTSEQIAKQFANNNGKGVYSRLDEVDAHLDEVTAQLAENVEYLADIAISVKTFGAKGDGITDDTEAIKRSISYCSENNKTPFFPDGIYLITSPIELSSSCRYLYGQSMHNTIILFDGVDGEYAIKASNVYSSARITNITIKSKTDKLCNGLDMTGISYSSIENVSVEYSNIGINLHNSFGTKFDKCRLNRCNTGVRFGTNSNSITFHKSRINECTLGIHLEGTTVGFTESTIEACDIAIFARFVYFGFIEKCHFEYNRILCDWNGGESIHLDFNNCYISALAGAEEVFKVNASSSSACYFTVKNCEFHGNVSVAIINHISGAIKFEWMNNSFKSTPQIITNSVRYDRMKSDGAISVPLNLVNGWTADSGLEPKIIIDSDGFFNLVGVIKGGVNGSTNAICDNFPTHMRPKATLKFPVHIGRLNDVGKIGVINIRPTSDIRQYGNTDGSEIYLNARWKV